MHVLVLKLSDGHVNLVTRCKWHPLCIKAALFQLPRACQHNAPLKLPQFVYTAELFGLIAAYPSQFNVINTSVVAMYGATEFWRCKHPGPCEFNGTSVLHSARCRYARHEVTVANSVQIQTENLIIIIIIIIIIFIYCKWVVTRWQWLCYMYTKHEIGYY